MNMINLTGKAKGEENFWSEVDDLPHNSLKTLKSLLYFRHVPSLESLDKVAKAAAAFSGNYTEALIGTPFFLCSRLEKALKDKGVQCNFILMELRLKMTKEGFKKIPVPAGILRG